MVELNPALGEVVERAILFVKLGFKSENRHGPTNDGSSHQVTELDSGLS